MQDVMQKRLAIVVMMVITALKISWGVGFLLKNDILQISFYNSFNTILPRFLLIGEGRGSPYRRGKRSLPGGRGFLFFFYLTRPLLLGSFRKLPRPLLTWRGAPPLPRPPLLRRGLQPVNRLFCTRKQALALKGCSWLPTQQSCDCLTQ